MKIKIPKGRADKWTTKDWENYALTLFRHENSLQSHHRLQREYDNSIYEGEIQDGEELAHKHRKYDQLRTNFISKAVDYLISISLAATLDGVLQPADNEMKKKGSKKAVSEYNEHFKAFVDFSGLLEARYLMIRDTAISGEGYMHERLYPDGKLGFGIDVVHKNWRNIWCDSKSIEEDLSDARYLFDTHSVRYEIARSRWQSEVEKIDKCRTSLNPEDTVGDREVNMIHLKAYFRINTKGDKESELWFAEFLLDEKHECIVMLDKLSKNNYGQKKIPFSRMIFSRLQKNNQPYSPIIRNHRNFDKTLTSFICEVEKARNPEDYNETIHRIANECIRDLQNKGIDLSYSINPTEISKLALKDLQQKTMRLIPQFLLSLRKSESATFNRLLSIVSEHAGHLHYGEDRNRELQTFEYNRDENLRGIRFKYHVTTDSNEEANRWEKVAKEMPLLQEMNVPMEVLQRWMQTAIDTEDTETSSRIHRIVDILRLHGVSINQQLLEKLDKK